MPAAYSSIRAAKRAGVKSGSVTTAGAAVRAWSSITWPAFVPMGKACTRCREWANGRRLGWTGGEARFAWVAATPLGRPVVPEV